MEKKSSSSKTKTVMIIAAVILVLLTAVYFAFGPKGTEGEKTVTVTVDHLNTEDTEFKITTDKEMLGDALEEEGLIKGSEGEFGMFVEKVDGETADASKEEWWGYSVDGETAENGVDSQPVEDGAVYGFKLNVGYDF